MNYFYDLTLNFVDENLMYYEWDEFDNIEVFKKVPLFQVSSKTLKEFIANQIKVNKEFLDIIKNKGKKKNEVCEYVALFADKNGAIAMEFSEDGLSIARSFLNIDDELCLLEALYTIRTEKIEYKIIKEIKFKSNLRYEDKIKRLINTEVNSLVHKNNFSKLKYLYMEWFNKVPNSNEEMVTEMKDNLKREVNRDVLRVYNLIKLSYSNV